MKWARSCKYSSTSQCFQIKPSHDPSIFPLKFPVSSVEPSRRQIRQSVELSAAVVDPGAAFRDLHVTSLVFPTFFRQRCFVWNRRRGLITFPLYVPSCWGKSVVKKKFTVWKFTPTLEANKFVTDFWWIFIFNFLKSTTFGSKFRQLFVIQTGRTTWVLLMVLLGTSTAWAFRIKIEERKHMPSLPNNCGSFCLYFHSCAFMAVTMPCCLSPCRKTACCFLVLNPAVWDNYRMQHATRSVQCVQNAFEPSWWRSDDLINTTSESRSCISYDESFQKSWSITTPLNTYYPCNILSYHISYYHQIILTICLISFVGTPTCLFTFQDSQQEPLASSKRSSGCASGLMESQPREILIPKQVHMDKRW